MGALVLLFGMIIAVTDVSAQNASISRLSPGTLSKNVLKSIPTLGVQVAEKATLKNNLILMGSTLALLAKDQEIYEGSRQTAHDLGLMKPTDSGQETQKLIGIELGSAKLDIRVPQSPNSFFWFFGEGITSLGLIVSLAGVGLVQNQAYEVETAGLLIEGLLTTGLIIFPIKLLTGRESPARQTIPGGKWQFYPGLSNYLHDQSRYYSYPSGHTATLVTVMTILTERYARLTWLQPLGMTMTGLLMFSLMNNRTHWASDFPLAIAIGYNVGINAMRGTMPVKEAQENGLFWHGILPNITTSSIGLSSAWSW